MIGKLSGMFEGATPDGAAIIMVAGVGYAVRTTSSALLLMQADTKKQVSLYIQTVVREDAIDLYGFGSDEELAFFKQLLNVSSIGPKTAIGVLNVADVLTLKRAIAQGDATMLTKVFGIGKKSAERIVVELRDKLALERSAAGDTATSGSDAEVIEALIALGYSAAEGRKALKEVKDDITGTRERLANALKYLGGHQSL